MNTKYIISAIPAAIVCSAVLSSCGVQIQLESALPAEVNFGRGSRIMFESCSDTDEGDYILSYLFDLMEKDGYYTPCGDGCRSPKAVLGVESYISSQKHKTKDGSYTTYKLNATVYIGNAYRRSFSSSVYRDSSGGLDTASTCRSIARSVMSDITPQSYTYYEKVKGNDENPYIEQGANQCAAGNWEEGKALALKALEKNANEPEAYFLLGLYERNNMNYDKSNSYFEKANQIKANGKYTSAIRKNSVLKRNEDAVRKQLGN